MSDATAPRRVTATVLAEMGFCEQACLMRARHGAVETAASAEAKRAGTNEHQRFHEQVSAQHNRSRTGTDRRCFIASAVYGQDDPRTDQLRQFRDRALMPHRSGRFLVRLYYRVSPSMVDAMAKRFWLRQGTRRILDQLRRRIAPGNISKEATHEQRRHSE